MLEGENGLGPAVLRMRLDRGDFLAPVGHDDRLLARRANPATGLGMELFDRNRLHAARVSPVTLRVKAGPGGPAQSSPRPPGFAEATARCGKVRPCTPDGRSVAQVAWASRPCALARVHGQDACATLLASRARQTPPTIGRCASRTVIADVIRQRVKPPVADIADRRQVAPVSDWRPAPASHLRGNR